MTFIEINKPISDTFNGRSFYLIGIYDQFWALAVSLKNITDWAVSLDSQTVS